MIKELTVRNIKLFLRIKSVVFFSFLGVLILIVLHFLIFGKMYTQNFAEVIVDVERKYLRFIADSMMFAALIPMSCVTLSLTALSQMVADKEKKQLSDFLVMPIKRSQLMFSYILASVVICCFSSLAMIAFFEIYFLITVGIGFSLLQIVYILLATLLSVIFANFFMLTVMSFVSSEKATGALGGIVGALYGFFAGAYVPVGILGDGMRQFFSVMPFLQLTAIMRHIFLLDAAKTIGASPELISGIERSYGSIIHFANQDISTLLLVVFVLAYSAVFGVVMGFKFKKL